MNVNLSRGQLSNHTNARTVDENYTPNNIVQEDLNLQRRVTPPSMLNEDGTP